MLSTLDAGPGAGLNPVVEGPRSVPSTRFEPARNFVLVRRDEALKQGLIYTPETTKLFTGTIVRVGPAVTTHRAGQRIAFAKHCGHDIREGNEDLLLLPDDAILGAYI